MVRGLKVYQAEGHFDEAQQRYKTLANAILLRSIYDYARRHKSPEAEYYGVDAYNWFQGRQGGVTFAMCASLLGYDEVVLRAICLSPRVQELAKNPRNLE